MKKRQGGTEEPILLSPLHQIPVPGANLEGALDQAFQEAAVDGAVGPLAVEDAERDEPFTESPSEDHELDEQCQANMEIAGVEEPPPQAPEDYQAFLAALAAPLAGGLATELGSPKAHWQGTDYVAQAVLVLWHDAEAGHWQPQAGDGQVALLASLLQYMELYPLMLPPLHGHPLNEQAVVDNGERAPANRRLGDLSSSLDGEGSP